MVGIGVKVKKFRKWRDGFKINCQKLRGRHLKSKIQIILEKNCSKIFLLFQNESIKKKKFQENILWKNCDKIE